MRHKLAIAMAVFLVAGMAGLSVTPTAAAVDPDCTEDFEIADLEASAQVRTLSVGATKTGLEDVLDVTDDEEVTVELLSNDDELEFGIFEDVDGCDRSMNVTETICQADVSLDTTGPNTEDSETCTIEAPDSGTREFYFVLKNVEQNGDSLDFKVFVSG